MIDGGAGSSELTVGDLIRSRDISFTTRRSDTSFHLKATHTPSGLFGEGDSPDYNTARTKAYEDLREKLVANGSPPLR